jgi:tetratricopeptide (TPR) repeat protein
LPLAVSAAKLAPGDPTVQTTLGLVQLSNRNNAEAKTAIDAGLKLNPAKPELHYLQGRYLLRATAPLTGAAVQNALASLKRALQYNPRFLEAAVIAADLNERLGDAQGSLDVLFNLVPRMPDEVALHSRVLDLLVNTDRDNATAYLRQILRTYPDVPDTVYALAGRLYDTDIALGIVADGEKRYATSAPLASTRGNLLERKTQYEDAVKAYKDALGRDKTLQRAGLSLAGTLSKLGRFDEAEATIQQTFGRVDQKLLTRMYLQTGRYDRAKIVLDKLSSTAATDVDVPYYQGIMLLRQYQTDDARKQLEAAVKIKPDDTRARTTLPELPDAQRLGAPKLTGPALYQLQLAQSLLDNGNPLEAAQVLENALKTNPNDLHLNFYYGYAQYQIKDPDEAVDQFNATLKLAPDNVVVMAFLAATYISNSRFDLAIDMANKAIAKDAKYGRAYFVLALANYTLGNAAPARDAFLKTIGVNADFKILVDPYLTALPK